ncbi:RNA polymerase II mediator complex subunit [Lambiella insularis]|nr:RNA polymerase II mediator complex subunit [Lambiella insularis]
MTTYYDAAERKPPLRTNATGVNRQNAANALQNFQLPPRSVPPSIISDSTSNIFKSQDLLGHVLKRQKTDNGYSFTASPPESNIKLENFTSSFRGSQHSEPGLETHSIQVSSNYSPISRKLCQTPPLPRRPSKQPLRKLGSLCAQANRLGRDQVQAKPYKLDTPRSAPQYGYHDSADFFPWVGTHLEDVLNEAHTRSGYFDKMHLFKECANNTQKDRDETSSARGPMYLGLKHKSGIHILSSLFISVLDQRRDYATIVARSSFRPPPRVTLTDTKREAWLRDLANPTIPLRRLSRTIPHGIRGRVLLDHCLAKSIPIWRAVWLAKCVGANEIRAFKRKGATGAFASGGETKWIKDWTTNVEQFVEAAVDSCGLPEWDLSMTYGLQLVKHIYSEHLLDKEHFLDWMIKSVHSSDAELRGSTQTPRQRLINLLDTSFRTLDHDSLSEASLEAVEDQTLLICTLLEWSTTEYRDGISRIYIALRLLATWGEAGLDLDQAILKFLGCVSATAGLHTRSVFKLIGELVRARLFSIGKYLQWLMAGGTHFEAALVGAFEVELLDNIPVYDLPQYVLNLRNILIRASGYPHSNAQNVEDAVKRSLGAKVCLLHECSIPTQQELLQDLTLLSGSAQFSISHWIKQRVVAACKHNSACSPGKVDHGFKRPPMSVTDFQAIRTMLEDLQDFPVLADVLDMVSTCSYRPLLEEVAETVNCHINILSAIGAADNLFRKLISGLEQYYTRDPSDKAILLSLIDLGENFPNAMQTTSRLQQEVWVCNSKHAGAACSPVSDNMAEALQSSDSNFPYEVELLLSSGSSMDGHVLSRIFDTVSGRLRTAWYEGGAELWSLVEILGQLRSFDPDSFDRLMLGWAQDCLGLSIRPALISLIAPLVCGRVLNVQGLLQQLISRLGAGAQEHDAGLSMDVLALFVTEPCWEDQSSISKMYRYHREIDKILYNSPGVVVALICHISKASVYKDTVIQQRLQTLLSSPRCLRLIRSVLLSYEPAALEIGRAFSVASLRNLAAQVLDNLLCWNTESCSNPSGVIQDIGRLLHKANDFNINLACVKLYVIFASQDFASNNNNAKDEGVSILVNEAAPTFMSRPAIWLSLLSALPEGCARMFHAECVSNFLASIRAWTSGDRPKASTLAEPGCSTEALLASINEVEDSLSGSGSVEMIATLLTKYSQAQTFCHLPIAGLDQVHEGVDKPHKIQATGEKCDMNKWIDVLLRLLMIHQNRIRQPKFPQQVLCQLVFSISLLVTFMNLRADSLLLIYLLDTIAFLTDSLTPESRIRCRAVLCDQHHLHDPRLQSIFSAADDNGTESLRIITASAASSLAADSTSYIPFLIRRWEMVQDATPVIGENDTSLSLTLFEARKAIF